MGLISYIRDIPDGPNNPSNDQPNMKLNNNAIEDYVAVDHVPFNVNNSGYHTIIHQTLQVANPAPISNIAQLFVKNVSITNSAGTGTDNQLFYETGLGGVSQITGSHSATNGFSFIAGVILQWGIIAPTSAGTVTVLFNTAPNFNFPNALLNVQVTRQRTTSSAGSSFSYWVDNTTTSRTGFNIINGDAHTYGYYWFAIGN